MRLLVRWCVYIEMAPCSPGMDMGLWDNLQTQGFKYNPYEVKTTSLAMNLILPLHMQMH